MTILSRDEQENMVVQFEREYGNLVMSKNCGKCGLRQFKYLALALSDDIRAIARDRYFEDDLLQHLDNLAESIEENTKLPHIYNKESIAA